MNSYYYGNMKFGDKADQKEWAQAIRLVFTNQSNRGNHMNISGGGVAKHAKNKLAAISFLEFLTQEKAQHLYGEINFEYPVNPKIEPTSELKSSGVSSSISKFSKPLETSGSSIICSSVTKLFVRTSLLFCSN